MNCHVGGGYGLAEGRGWCDGRKEGDDYFERVRLLGRGIWNQVREVGCRSIVLGSNIGRERYVVAFMALAPGVSINIPIDLRIIFMNRQQGIMGPPQEGVGDARIWNRG